MTRRTDFTADWFTGHADEWLAAFGWMKGRPVRALEVGSYEGRSALWLLETLLVHPGSRLTCIDTWDGADAELGAKTAAAEGRFDRNLGPELASGRCRKLKGLSSRLLPALLAEGAPFDLAFVDGSHEGLDALTDLVLCWGLLAPGGQLVFDDYKWTGPHLRAQPRDAWDGFAGVRPRMGEIRELGRAKWVTKDGGTT